jgi:hypothetical protein
MTDAISELEHRRALGRARAKRFYEAHKIEVLEKQKQIRVDALAFRTQETRKDADENDNYNYEVRGDDDDAIAFPNRKVVIKRNKLGVRVAVPKSIPLERCLDVVNKMTENDTHRPLAPATLRKYSSNIRSYFTRTGCKDLLPHLNSPQIICENISKFDIVVSSKLDICQAIIKLLNMGIVPKSIYLDSNYEILNNYYRILKKESDENRNKKKGDEKDSVFHIDDLKKVILDKYGLGSKQNIVINLFSECLKRDDFYLTVTNTVPTDKTKNYLIVPKTGVLKVLIHVHKTAGRYEAESDNLSAGLSKEIRGYITKNKIQIGSPLFKEVKLTGFLTKMFKDAGVDDKVAVNYLRHSAVSSEPNNLTKSQVEMRAKKMNHSYELHQLYRRKIKRMKFDK